MLFAVFTNDGFIERVNEKDLRRWAESFNDEEYSLNEAINYLESERNYKVEQLH